MPIWHQSPKLTPRYFLETPRLFGYPSFYMEYEKGRYTTPTKLRGLITLILIYYQLPPPPPPAPPPEKPPKLEPMLSVVLFICSV